MEDSCPGSSQVRAGIEEEGDDLLAAALVSVSLFPTAAGEPQDSTDGRYLKVTESAGVKREPPPTRTHPWKL